MGELAQNFIKKSKGKIINKDKTSGLASLLYFFNIFSTGIVQEMYFELIINRKKTQKIKYPEYEIITDDLLINIESRLLISRFINLNVFKLNS